MADSLGFDPSTRRETWLFQLMFIDPGGKKVWRRLAYNLVSYDGNPERYIEPVSAAFDDQIEFDPNKAGDPGAVVGFEFFESRPFEFMSVNDNVDIT